MSKNPVLPLYYNDINSSTEHWSDEEFGAYMRLLIHQWDKGGLPDDSTRLKRIASTVRKHWKLLKDKFKKDPDGQLRNPRMEEIRINRNKFLEKQAENIRKRYQTSTKDTTKVVTKPPTNTATKTLPLEAEIEKENGLGGPGGRELGSDRVTRIANIAWADKGWKDSLCMGLSIAESELKKWMAQFNASISNDWVEDFSPPRYKKMIRGWISKQQQSGHSINSPDSQKSSAPPLKTI